MSAIYKRGNAEVSANLTPMIDVTFLLIVFFVLVSQIVEVENVDMNLPEPIDALTEPVGEEQRMVINVVPDQSDSIEGYRVGTSQFRSDVEGVEALTELLTTMFRKNPDIVVNLRADQRTHYQWVEPAMQAVVNAARRTGVVDMSARINLVVINKD